MRQMQLDRLSPCRAPKVGTQHHALLTAMQRGERLTVAVALTRYGCYALSQRVGELKRQGWPIQSRRVDTAGGANVAEYWLE